MDRRKVRHWRQWREDEARAVLAEHARSGQSLTRFAGERGISLRRLMYWRKRLNDGATPAKFVAVAIPPARSAGSARIEVAVDDVTIRVPEDLDADVVVRIAVALARGLRAGC